MQKQYAPTVIITYTSYPNFSTDFLQQLEQKAAQMNKPPWKLTFKDIEDFYPRDLKLVNDTIRGILSIMTFYVARKAEVPIITIDFESNEDYKTMAKTCGQDELKIVGQTEEDAVAGRNQAINYMYENYDFNGLLLIDTEKPFALQRILDQGSMDKITNNEADFLLFSRNRERMQKSYPWIQNISENVANAILNNSPYALSSSRMRGSIQIIYIDSHFHGNDNEFCVT